MELQKQRLVYNFCKILGDSTADKSQGGLTEEKLAQPISAVVLPYESEVR